MQLNNAKINEIRLLVDRLQEQSKLKADLQPDINSLAKLVEDLGIPEEDINLHDVRININSDTTVPGQGSASEQNEQLFKSLAENLPDVICRFDRQFRYLYINNAIQPITGLSPQDFIGKTARELRIADNQVDIWDGKLNQVFESGKEGSIEFNFSVNNTTSYFESRLIPEFGTEGRVETVLAIVRNITVHKQNADALRASEQFAKATVDALSAHLAILDENGIIIAVNNAWRDFAHKNGANADENSEGTDYLEICDRAVGEYSDEAAACAAGIRAVILFRRWTCAGGNNARKYFAAQTS
jgi:PAS domain S-box-containing protein